MRDPEVIANGRILGHRVGDLARICLSHFAAQGKFTDDIDQLVRRACREYKASFPEWGRHFPRRIEPWLFYDGNPKTMRISPKRPPERVDVYCLFCRVILVNAAVWQADYTMRTRPHTTACALRCLAGIDRFGEPGTYRLPEAV